MSVPRRRAFDLPLSFHISRCRKVSKESSGQLKFGGEKKVEPRAARRFLSMTGVDIGTVEPYCAS